MHIAQGYRYMNCGGSSYSFHTDWQPYLLFLYTSFWHTRKAGGQDGDATPLNSRYSFLLLLHISKSPTCLTSCERGWEPDWRQLRRRLKLGIFDVHSIDAVGLRGCLCVDRGSLGYGRSVARPDHDPYGCSPHVTRFIRPSTLLLIRTRV